MGVFNGARYLRGAIDSILRQTFMDFEFIVIDDASSDETPRVIEQVQDPRLISLRHEAHLGLTRALNRGLAISTGQYIARMDADDISTPHRLALQVQYLDRHAHVGLVGVAPTYIDATGRPAGQWNVLTTNDELQAQLARSNCFCHGSVMFRRECVDLVGPYSEEFALAQDYDLWLRIAEWFDLANLPDPLYHLRLHDAQLSRAHAEAQRRYVARAREAAGFRRRHLAQRLRARPASGTGSDGVVRRRLADRRWLAQRYFLFAMGRRRLRDRRGAAGFLWRALLTHPAHGPTWVYLTQVVGRALRG
jgi:glycosyltransferase involved in cell wall biosynthesis